MSATRLCTVFVNIRHGNYAIWLPNDDVVEEEGKRNDDGESFGLKKRIGKLTGAKRHYRRYRTRGHSDDVSSALVSGRGSPRHRRVGGGPWRAECVTERGVGRGCERGTRASEGEAWPWARAASRGQTFLDGGCGGHECRLLRPRYLHMSTRLNACRNTLLNIV